MSVGPIRLFLADVDGTLVTHDKVLTNASIEAVRRLRAEGVLFAVTSGRPPRGMGNADPQVQRAARRTTDTNDDDSFAKAVARFVLPQTVSRLPHDGKEVP